MITELFGQIVEVLMGLFKADSMPHCTIKHPGKITPIFKEDREEDTAETPSHFADLEQF